MPGVAHFLYIPLCLGIGFILGWQLGGNSVQNRWDRAEAKRKAQDEG